MAYKLPENVNSAYYTKLLVFSRILSSWVYTFHMPLFFILSGAVFSIGSQDKRYDSVVVSKLRRLLIPYFVYGIFFMIPVKFLGDFYKSNNVLLALRSFIYGGDSGHLWFLPALFWCICFYSLLEKLLLRLGCESKAVMLAIAGLITMCSNKFILIFFYLKNG